MKARSSQALKRVVELFGLGTLGSALYYRTKLLRGLHTIGYHGSTLRFTVTTRREIDRLDYIHEEEKELLDQLLRTLRPGDVLFDVGANIGVVSLIAAATHPEITVYAFEPMPENLEALRANIKLNGMEDRVHAHPIALSDHQGTAVLFADNQAGEGTSSLVNTQKQGRKLTIETDTMDHFLDRTGVVPDVVKIDVEGAEWEVIKGARGVCQNPKCRSFIIEVHTRHLRSRGLDDADLISDLTSAGFAELSRSRRGAEYHIFLERAERPT